MTYALAKSSVFRLNEVIRANTDWEYEEGEGLHFGWLSSDQFDAVATYINGALKTLFLLSEGPCQENSSTTVPAQLTTHVREVAEYPRTIGDDDDPLKYLARVHKDLLKVAAADCCIQGPERQVRKLAAMFSLMGEFLVLVQAHIERAGAGGGLEHGEIVEVFRCIDCVEGFIDALNDAEWHGPRVGASFHARASICLTHKWLRTCTEDAVSVVQKSYLTSTGRARHTARDRRQRAEAKHHSVNQLGTPSSSTARTYGDEMTKYGFPNPADDIRARLTYTVAAEFICRLDLFLERHQNGARDGTLPPGTVATVKHCAEVALAMLCCIARAWEEKTSLGAEQLDRLPELLSEQNQEAALMVAGTAQVLKGLLKDDTPVSAAFPLVLTKYQLMFTLGGEIFLRLGALTEDVMRRARGAVDPSEVAMLRGCIEAAKGMVHKLKEVDWLKGHEGSARAILAMHGHVIRCRLEESTVAGVRLIQAVCNAVTDQVLGD
jgi:hypothetical protein